MYIAYEFKVQRLISLLRAQRMHSEHPLGWKICDKRSGVLERLLLEYPSIRWQKILQTEIRQRAPVCPTLLACVVHPRILKGEGIMYFSIFEYAHTRAILHSAFLLEKRGRVASKSNEL
jgi:hypothetical protein